MKNKEKLIIAIAGMSCASCVAAIENSLRSFKGVISAKVNFAAEKAYVEYDPALTDLPAIEKVITATGYTVIKENREQRGGTGKLDLKVVGMDNPHCVGTVGGAIDSLPGIIAKVLRVNEKASINYDPAKVTAEQIKAAILAVGYTPIEEAEATLDVEKEAREKEIRNLKNRLLFSNFRIKSSFFDFQ